MNTKPSAIVARESLNPNPSPLPLASVGEEGTLSKATLPKRLEEFTSGEVNHDNTIAGKSIAVSPIPRVPLSSQLQRLILNVAPLIATDIAVGAICFFIATAVADLTTGMVVQSMQIAFLMPALFVSLAVMGVYPGIGISPIVELRRLSLGVTTLMATLLAALMWGVRPSGGIVLFAIVSWMLLQIGLPLGRAIVRSLLARTSWWGEPVLILGGGSAGKRVCDALTSQLSRGMRPAAMIDPVHYHCGDDNEQYDVYVGPPKEIPSLIARHHITWAIVANVEGDRPTDHAEWKSYLGLLPNLLVEGTNLLPSLWTESQECGDRPAFHVGERLAMRWPRLIKRAVDIAASLAVLTLCLPLFAFVAVTIKIVSPGPIFFQHERFGRRGNRFGAWKFRSMVLNANEVLERHLADSPEVREEWDQTQKLKNDPRVLPFIGTRMRRWSIDELPQLWNVLTGEMSLVGPRPVPVSELDSYGAENIFGHYSFVRPGITGLWQVSGRSNASYESKPLLDEYYVRNWSPWLDTYILARTIRTVLTCEGAY